MKFLIVGSMALATAGTAVVVMTPVNSAPSATAEPAHSGLSPAPQQLPVLAPEPLPPGTAEGEPATHFGGFPFGDAQTPFQEIGLTQSESDLLYQVFIESDLRQKVIDMKEQEGEISAIHHAALSAELELEMEARIDNILGEQRSVELMQLIQSWVIELTEGRTLTPIP